MPKPDAEGEFVANIIRRQKNVPRPLPRGSLLRLYFLSPNSRYAILAGFVAMAGEAVFIFLQLHPDPYPNSTSMLKLWGGFLMLFAFAFPLVNVSRVRRAIQYGISTTGHVEGVKNARTTTYSTPAGMTNGAIRALVSYTVDGQPFQADVFLDRPWISDVQGGTQLELLIDPDKHTILYVVGIKK